MQEKMGLDAVVVSSEAALRMAGQPSALSYLGCQNANDTMFAAARKVCRVVRHTPVLGGIAPGDPYRELDELLDTAEAIGLDGITNLPSGAGFGSRLNTDVRGSILHSDAECYLMRRCQQRDIFYMAVVFDPQGARLAAAEGADLVVAHGGFTLGGSCGAPENEALPMELLCQRIGQMAQAVWEEAPQTPVLCHGNILNTPERVQQCLDATGTDGFFGGNGMDAIPMEQAVGQVVTELEGLELQGGADK
jgi:predicted TIM-barrel enzyme